MDRDAEQNHTSLLGFGGISVIKTALGTAIVVATVIAWNSGDSTDTAPEPPGVVLMAPMVSWTPATPLEGHLFSIQVVGSAETPLIGVHGTFAGEELHFERAGDGRFRSLAAMPVGATGAAEGSVRVVYEAGGEETMSVTVPVEAVAYRHEELRVAPRFGSPLNDADRARLQGDQGLAAGAARAAHRTPRIWTGEAVMPRTSVVTSGFGDGRVFNGQVSSRHMGLDLRGLSGDTVVAAARGVVALVEPFLLAGNIVYLNHGGGLLSAYFHLSQQLVAPGDTVEMGQPVGLVGATGRVTGPHLHWVVRYGTTSVDPRSLLSSPLQGEGQAPPGEGRPKRHARP
jgi:hypothetical protein